MNIPRFQSLVSDWSVGFERSPWPSWSQKLWSFGCFSGHQGASPGGPLPHWSPCLSLLSCWTCCFQTGCPHSPRGLHFLKGCLATWNIEEKSFAKILFTRIKKNCPWLLIHRKKKIKKFTVAILQCLRWNWIYEYLAEAFFLQSPKLFCIRNYPTSH